MRVYKIGVVGHTPSKFLDAGVAKIATRNTILTLMDQYEPNPICFNVFATPGVGFWAASNCFEYGADYDVYIPCMPELYMHEWPFGMVDDGQSAIDHCSELIVAGQVYNKESVCNSSRLLVDQSDFIVVFWEGRKSGLTYETMKYAFENSKILLNGLDDLSLITKKHFVKSDRGE